MLLHLSVCVAIVVFASPSFAAESCKTQDIDRLAKEVEAKVIEWRRDIHQHPELGNREFRTGKVVATHLQKLGLEFKYRRREDRRRCLVERRQARPRRRVARRHGCAAGRRSGRFAVRLESQRRIRRQGSRRDACLRA